MADAEKISAWVKLCEHQDGDFENFKSEYQVQRINSLMDSLREAIASLKKLKDEAPMHVLFYDRKNKRTVSSRQLMPTKIVSVYMTADSEEYRSGVWQGQEKHPLHYSEEIIGTFGYKSAECPKWQNFDNFCNIEDLVILDIES